MSAETKLKEQGLVLPQVSSALGSYVPVLQLDGMLYLSGVLSKNHDGEVFKGRLGEDSNVERGQQAARLAVLNALAVLRHHLGNLDRVQRIVRLVGYLQTEKGFSEHSKVLNGASDLLLSVFGEKGRHARSAVGVFSLPLGACVEIELTVQAGSE